MHIHPKKVTNRVGEVLLYLYREEYREVVLRERSFPERLFRGRAERCRGGK